jgi:2-phospho-L-lactate guanylyltransferase
VITVIPFRAGGKSRLPSGLRRHLALAMLGDVVEAALAVGAARVVTDDVDAADAMRAAGAVVIADPGGGQGAAVVAGLEAAEALALVVNADLPLATPGALGRLAASAPGLVRALDGTTNALSIRDAHRFVPRFGEGSAARYAADGFRPVSIPELEADVDTLADLERLTLHVGWRTTVVVNRHKSAAHAR